MHDLIDSVHLGLMVALGPEAADNPTEADLRQAVGHLQQRADLLREQLEQTLREYSPCRCRRDLICPGCRNVAGECDCSDVYDELEDQAAEEAPDDPGTDDPHARVLLGFPSGLHCHTNGCPDA